MSQGVSCALMSGLVDGMNASNLDDPEMRESLGMLGSSCTVLALHANSHVGSLSISCSV